MGATFEDKLENETPEQTRQRELHRDARDETGFWGRRGAGCLFLSNQTERILFAHRSDEVLEPNTWGTWGGAIDIREDPATAVRREVVEETEHEGSVRLIPLVVFKHESGFRYHNFLAIVEDEFEPELNWETQGYAWVDFGRWPTPLHPGAKYLIHHSLATIRTAIREM